MESGFSNRTDWLALSLALIVWTGHFALAWAASVIFPGQPVARWIAAALTLGSLAALYALWRWRGVQSAFSVGGLGILLAGGGIVFGAMPAVIG